LRRRDAARRYHQDERAQDRSCEPSENWCAEHPIVPFPACGIRIACNSLAIVLQGLRDLPLGSAEPRADESARGAKNFDGVI
jgi:hypothetical protein